MIGVVEDGEASLFKINPFSLIPLDENY